MNINLERFVRGIQSTSRKVKGIIMSTTLKKLWNDETGLIISGELVLICT